MNNKSTNRRGVDFPPLIFIILLALSVFTIAKTYVATGNVAQWSDDLLKMFIREQTEAGRRSDSIEPYLQRIASIQKQWTVMRYIGIAGAAFSCCGIFLTGGRTREQRQETRGHNRPANQSIFDRRLIFALVCIAILPLLELLLLPNAGLLVLACIALVVLLPVLIRGSRQQRFLAIVLMLAAGYFAYKDWVAAIQPRL